MRSRGGKTASGALLLAAALSLGACGDSVAPFDIRDVQFAPELEVDLEAMEERPSGLFLETLVQGEGGEARAGERVWTHYTVWLPNGSVLDDSRERSEPFEFVIGGTGNDQAIPGFEEGVDGMLVGEIRRLVVPPDLAYGDTTLVFEVELLSVGDPPEEQASA